MADGDIDRVSTVSQRLWRKGEGGGLRNSFGVLCVTDTKTSRLRIPGSPLPLSSMINVNENGQ